MGFVMVLDEENSSTNFAYSVKSGFELFITDKLFLDTYAEYEKIDNVDAVSAGTGFNYCITKKLRLGLSGAYEFENEVSLFAGSIAYIFDGSNKD